MTADAQAPGHFTFAHGIVRDAIREALPEQRRGAVHEAVASALVVRRDAGADVPAAQIAHHALAAARAGADPQPAWEAALEAAREGERGARPRRGRRALRRRAGGARAGRRGAGRPSAATRCSQLAEATICAGDIEEARRRYSQAAAAARRDGDGETLARAALGFAQVRPYGAVDEESVTLLSQALERLERRPAEGPRHRPAVRLLARAGAPRGADRRGAGVRRPTRRRARGCGRRR